MKGLCLLLILFITASLYIDAAPVDVATANKVAENFFRNDPANKFKSANVFSNLKFVKGRQTISGNIGNMSGVYIFKNQTGSGFVITSSDKSMPPILGYSYENNIDPNNLPPQLLDMINRWSNDSVRSVISAKNGYKNSNEWKKLLSDNQPTFISNRSASIEPLVKTKWGQGQFYNDLCPIFYSGNRAPAGCVAIAIAQILKYWSFPDYGSGELNYDDIYGTQISVNFGQTKYNWANMPESLSAPNNDMATLCLHTGAAVLTNYESSGSGASTTKVPDGLMNYFNFSNIKLFSSFTNTPTGTITHIADYINIIENELIGNRPVIFGGNNGSVGHAYICDGVQDNLFHLNFGWNGYADGYYNMETELEYNKYLWLVYNIMPSGISISNKYPSIGENVNVGFTAGGTPNFRWDITPNENVVVEQQQAGNSQSINLKFSEMGNYKIQASVINATDTVYIEEKTISVTFSPIKNFGFHGGVACGQSWPTRWFDFDNDGDLDVYCGYSNYIYENINGNFKKKYPMSSTYNGSFQVFDYNNDGFIDIVKADVNYISGKYNMDIVIHKNLQGNGFEKQNFNLPSLGGGTIIPRDFNNDGYVDLLIYGTDYLNNTQYDEPYLLVLLNRINNFEKIFETRPTQNFRSEGMVVCDDFDNDGDIDFIARDIGYIGSIDKSCILFVNNEDTFSQVEIPFQGRKLTSGDIDGNGTLDFVSSTHDDHDRIGTFDVNNDGKTDLFMTRTIYPSQYVGFDVFINGQKNATSCFPGFAEGFTPLLIDDKTFAYIPDENPSYYAPDAHCGDYNNDGFSDVAVGSSILRNPYGKNSFTINTPPTVPSNLKSVVGCGKVTLSWNKATDKQTPADGLSYNIVIGTTSDGVDIVSPMSDLSTGKRKIVNMGNVYQNTSFEIKDLSPGTYYWSVQAIDNGYEGGPFATEGSFVIENILVPEPAGIITGDTIIQQGQESVFYSLPEIKNATSYVWTLPDSTEVVTNENKITINFSSTAKSGKLTVKGRNSCFEGEESFLYIYASSVISAIITPPTGGDVIGVKKYLVGNTCTLTAIPSIGYTFVNWTENNIVVSTDTNYTFIVDTTRTLVANFTLNKYNLTFSPPSNGTLKVFKNDAEIQSGTHIEYGTNLFVSAVPDTGYQLASLQANGKDVVDNTITIMEATEIKAIFEQLSAIIDIRENNYSSNYDIVLFPNPTKGNVSIFIPYNENDITIEIFSLLGKLLFKEKYTFPRNRLIDLDISTLSDGIYLVNIKTKSIQQGIKLVKNTK